MEENNNEISRIKVLLASHAEGMSITEIAGNLQINRNSVAKYMDILQIQGTVDGRKRGTSKVYYLSERLPASSLRKVCTRPFLIVNQDDIVVDLNTEFQHLMLVSPDQVLNRSASDLPLRFLDGSPSPQVFRAVLRGAEQRVRGQIHQGQKILSVTFLLIPVVFDSGKPGVCVIAETGSANTNGSLPDPRSQEILALLDDQMEYVVRHTPEGIILYVNETFCRAVGKMREELVGRPFNPLVSPEDTQRIQSHRAHLTIQYPVGIIEYRAVMAHGELQYQRWHERALFNARNELVSYNSCGIDITDQVLATNKLRKTQETLEESIVSRTADLRGINRQLYEEISRREKTEEQLLLTKFAMDSAADMIFWVDKNARVQYANTLSTQVLGYAGQELLDHSFFDIVPGYSLVTWDALWNDLKQGGAAGSETTLVKKDGQSIPAEMKCIYLEYHGREFVYCFLRDITERTRMERALWEANKKLNVLTSITRHDIQNKITVLLGYLGRTKKVTRDPVILDYLDRQEQAAKAISTEINLTREFKDLGQQPPEWQNLRPIIQKAMEKYEKSGITFVMDIPQIEIYADVQLDHVFHRLFDGAVQICETISTFRIHLAPDGPDLHITIENDGCSIPADQREQLFDLHADGSGLRGLFLAREILSLTGIRLAESGEPDHGLRFVLEIPVSYFRYLPTTE
jgi:PAS domain S-box-containing protein